MANRGRPKKNIEETVEVVDMNEDIEITEQNETIESAIGELSDSLIVDGDTRVLSTITEDIVMDDAPVEDEKIKAEIADAVNDFADEAEDDQNDLLTDTPYDEDYFQLLYKDADNHGWTFTEKIVNTEAQAQLWVTRGSEQREIRKYIKLTLVDIE
jgi:hypothetical protein